MFYDHSADKKEKKWDANIKLVKEEDQFLPNYIVNNKNILKEWLD